MVEKHYTFLKANRVENTLVFESQDDNFAQRICDENDYDSFIWLDENPTPSRWSTHDEATGEFTEPTNDYLISIGILEEQPIDPTPAP